MYLHGFTLRIYSVNGEFIIFYVSVDSASLTIKLNIYFAGLHITNIEFATFIPKQVIHIVPANLDYLLEVWFNKKIWLESAFVLTCKFSNIGFSNNRFFRNKVQVILSFARQTLIVMILQICQIVIWKMRWIKEVAKQNFTISANSHLWN